jgi:hypothetical protein
LETVVKLLVTLFKHAQEPTKLEELLLTAIDAMLAQPVKSQMTLELTAIPQDQFADATKL